MTQPPAMRRRALVTGASAGIGSAFARDLAARGYDLVLTARRAERLAQLAADLHARHAIDVVTLTEDLADPAAPARLADHLARKSLAIDVLVNNAGYGVPGAYVTTTWASQRDVLQVLVGAVAELTHRLLPAMIERRWGRIINVASVAGLMPGVAGHTLYAASKAFLIRFSESLALEGARHGVHVCASCPGFTLTEFHDVTGTRAQVSTMPRWMWLDAETVARESYDAVTRGVPVYVPGRLYKVLTNASRILPQSLVRGVMMRNAGRFRRV
jgi:uncharacterized protein